MKQIEGVFFLYTASQTFLKHICQGLKKSNHLPRNVSERVRISMWLRNQSGQAQWLPDHSSQSADWLQARGGEVEEKMMKHTMTAGSEA